MAQTGCPTPAESSPRRNHGSAPRTGRNPGKWPRSGRIVGITRASIFFADYRTTLSERPRRRCKPIRQSQSIALQCGSDRGGFRDKCWRRWDLEKEDSRFYRRSLFSTGRSKRRKNCSRRPTPSQVSSVAKPHGWGISRSGHQLENSTGFAAHVQAGNALLHFFSFPQEWRRPRRRPGCNGGRSWPGDHPVLCCTSGTPGAD